ncbi:MULTISPECIES: hydantoinase B/oxoprolinase family protein [Streptomyces]|uniref:hydantoinase B/oxoprolinase family protein n=2 Tax=Streptomyces TaxID=1883 RepID=UPI001FF17C07|nr:hydantoinase B/oxoprolinase family protein [Streptomyces sp. AgN23]
MMAVTPVPGSEIFASRPYTNEEIRTDLPARLSLYPTDLSGAEVDPLTYEVVRNRIFAITDLMGDALRRMSGSLVVTDCNDFDVALTDPYGHIVQVGPYNTQLVASIGLAIGWILRNRADNPGIEPGDMFLCSDPWVGGGLHQNDVALFAPLFHDGKLFGWTAAVAHQLDVGGVSPGSWTPRAEDVFWESLPMPPIKVVRGGVIQCDVEDAYVRRSRIPKLVALDLRAKVGANKLGHERIAELIRKFDADTVQQVMQLQMRDAEQRLRDRLATIPDGTWTAVNHQEQSHTGDRKAHAIRLKLTKTGSDLLFDFTGTDEQSGMINCTFTGLYGGIISAMMPLLCGDLPWAPGGIMRCVDIISEPGTLNNATFPAAVGKGSVASSWATTNAVMECLSQMLDTHPSTRSSVASVCCGSWDLSIVAGLNQHGAPFATSILEPMAGGFGAGSDHDGVDTAGLPFIPMGKVPDVEMNEFTTPLLYLWRREETDSGGPGRYRGGLSGSVAFTPYHSPAPIYQVISGSGKAVSMNRGLAGGHPGAAQEDIAVRGSDAAELLARGELPSTVAELGGTPEFPSNQEESLLQQGDVYVMRWQGGGGYGDPVLRDPELVATDVRELKVSPDAARTVYGVVLDDSLTVDATATAACREAVRADRRNRVQG